VKILLKKNNMLLKEISTAIPAHFSPLSRVWIYAADRDLTAQESALAKDKMQAFVHSWTAHGAVVQGIGTVLFNRFLILAADETLTRVSGCSTDSSVHMMQDLQRELGIDLFNRTLLSFYQEGKISHFPLSLFSRAIQEGSVQPGTYFFDHTAGTKEAFENRWLLPVNESWLAKRFPELREEVS
jgi:hypothetical protein